MNIRINNEIRKKFHPGFDRKHNPSEIVIHGTGGGASAAVMINWMLSGERGNEYRRGVALYHYLIDFSGDVMEIIDPEKWVYHSSSGGHDAETIGIELMNKTAGNSDGYTDTQYKALFSLIDLLMEKYKITSIVGHGHNGKKYSNMDKACPGNFDWRRLGEHLSAAGLEYKYEPRNYHDIA